MKTILLSLVPQLLNLLSPDLFRKAMDFLIDLGEEAAHEAGLDSSKGKVIIYLCRQLREAFDLPDDDEIN